MTKSNIQTISFAITVVLVTAAFVWLLQPYYGGVLWALIFAILFRALYRRLAVVMRGCTNLAVALCLIIFIVLVPTAIVLNSLVDELSSLYENASHLEFNAGVTIRSVREGQPPLVVRLLSWVGMVEQEQFQTKITSLIALIQDSVARMTVRIGQRRLHLTINVGIMLYLLFFLFRDGGKLVNVIRRASPLSHHHTEHILAKFTSVVQATVKGNVAIAVLQGALAGAMFWLLEIEAAPLWSVVLIVFGFLVALLHKSDRIPSANPVC